MRATTAPGLLQLTCQSATTAIGMINGLMLGTGWGVFHTTDNLVRSNDVVGFSKGARLVAREAANTGAYTAALVGECRGPQRRPPACAAATSDSPCPDILFRPT